MKTSTQPSAWSGFTSAVGPTYPLATLIAILLVAGPAREAAAVPLAYEGFQYLPNQPLPTMGGGIGWAGPWIPLSGAMVDQPPSLNYPSAPPSTGDALMTLGTGAAFRPFAAPFNNASSDLWISFEELTSVGAVPGATVDIQPVAALPNITVNKDAGGNVFLNGILAGPSVGVGFVDFFVLQLVQWNGADTLVNLYLDPGAILGPPSASIVLPGPMFQTMQFNYQANAGQLLDEIRMGTTVMDVAAVPEPDTFTLLTGALLLLLLFAARSGREPRRREAGHAG